MDGDYTSFRRLFACFGVNECNGGRREARCRRALEKVANVSGIGRHSRIARNSVSASRIVASAALRATETRIDRTFLRHKPVEHTVRILLLVPRLAILGRDSLARLPL